MKQWCHKIGLNTINLEPELNTFAGQGYEIFRLWRITHDTY